MVKTKIIGMFRLFRFELPFTAGVSVVLGELLAKGTLPNASEIILGFLSVFFISAAALILNDYFDIESDKINAPYRPLPSGMVTEREVILLTIIVTFLGFLTGFLISIFTLFVIVIVWVVGFLYNWRFKKTGFIGNLMVAFSVGMTFILGGMAVNKPFEMIVWFFAILVMLIDLGEEITADAMDIEGDRLAGSKSLAVIYGRETALKISRVIFLLVVAITCFPFIAKMLEFIYLVPFLLLDLVILHSIFKLSNPDLANGRIYIRRIYLTGLATLLISIILRITGL